MLPWELWLLLSVILYTASTTIVFMRLYYRRQRRALQLSDYVVFGTWILATFYEVSTIYLGLVAIRPQSKVQQPLLGDEIPISNYIYLLSYRLVVPMAKVSILLLYLEIAQSHAHRICMRITMYCIGLYTTAFFFFTVFGCIVQNPEGHVWSVLDPGGLYEVFSDNEADSGHNTMLEHKCIPQEHIILAFAICNLFGELAIVVQSIPFVYKIRATVAQRLGLSFAFTLGFFTIAASITTALYARAAYRDLLYGVYSFRKFYVSGIWGMVEVHCALIFTNVLPVRAVIIAFFAQRIKALSSSGCLSTMGKSTNTVQTAPKSDPKPNITRRSDVLVVSSIDRDPDDPLFQFIPYVAPGGFTGKSQSEPSLWRYASDDQC